MIRDFRYTTLGLALCLMLPASAIAQSAPKTLVDNDKATVTENAIAPGATVKISAPRGPFFARYYLSSGTLEFTYADGTKETMTRKAGTAVIISAGDKRPVSVRNTGKTALRSITMSVK